MWDKLRSSLSARNAASTVEQYLKQMAELARVLKISYHDSAALCSITEEDANHYVNWCKSQPAQKGRSALIGETVSLSTVKRKLNSLSSCYKHLIRLKLATLNPFEDLRDSFKHYKGGDRRPTGMLEFETLKKLLETAHTDVVSIRDIAIIAALAGGGLRRSEAASLRILDLKRDRKGRLYFQLRNTKKQCAADQVLLPFSRPPIERYLEIRLKDGAQPMDAFFVAYTGREASTANMTGSAVYKIFCRWMAKIGLDASFTPHCARATAITLCLERGKSDRETQGFSRHSSVEMVAHYDKLRKKFLADDFDDIDL